ncbi:alcohol dehydrogenase catalytic domain-containing protein [Actinotalea sp. M2MS4P-6]|uniref:alcohol dehydrogenase catalytic domain-containing protein n=1 Tax=Actinotalea sp. M2MS4P-6 TaxID=2983762 RepID=UPI0021E3965B|nr:alcohol dehydrogenase catalytic domain-containing protein [Actinotalea sp. M2MS4P-6]MCV2394193.1 alcohol dehydrogenase catalytic domain-containing protein [Actinotalea sp. M2MS4P-6]
MTTQGSLPETQHAVQLVAQGEAVLNPAKPVYAPGPHEILLKIEAVGLCFSDIKLRKQFSGHPRKSEIHAGIDPEVLHGCRSYVPGDKPGVPGHEVVGRIVAVGDEVTRHSVGERVLVQTDYRSLPTDGSNAAFGYTFEGGLQEYTLLDERVVIEPTTGERYLIPAPEHLSASSIALCEPWSCVENAFASADRRGMLPGGAALVVADAGRDLAAVAGVLPGDHGELVAVVADDAQRGAAEALGARMADLDALEAGTYDDVVYLGSDGSTIERLQGLLAHGAVINLVLGGEQIGAPVQLDVGQVHYGGARWIGTTGSDPAESWAHVPVSGRLREGERVLIVGAAGPMGQMHMIFSVAADNPPAHLVGTDIDDERLAALRAKVEPFATRRGVPVTYLNTKATPIEGTFTYQTIMVPSAALAAASIATAADGCIIDVFAGIPAGSTAAFDLDGYVAKHCYMFGTSGSNIEDMKNVLAMVSDGRLDTNVSVDAVSGMAGAIDGLGAVETQALNGKVIIYPSLSEMGMTRLSDLPGDVAAKVGGIWNATAEHALLGDQAEGR